MGTTYRYSHTWALEAVTLALHKTTLFLQSPPFVSTVCLPMRLITYQHLVSTFKTKHRFNPTFKWLRELNPARQNQVSREKDHDDRSIIEIMIEDSSWRKVRTCLLLLSTFRNAASLDSFDSMAQGKRMSISFLTFFCCDYHIAQLCDRLRPASGFSPARFTNACWRSNIQPSQVISEFFFDHFCWENKCHTINDQSLWCIQSFWKACTVTLSYSHSQRVDTHIHAINGWTLWSGVFMLEKWGTLFSPTTTQRIVKHVPSMRSWNSQ